MRQSTTPWPTNRYRPIAWALLASFAVANWSFAQEAEPGKKPPEPPAATAPASQEAAKPADSTAADKAKEAEAKAKLLLELQKKIEALRGELQSLQSAPAAPAAADSKATPSAAQPAAAPAAAPAETKAAAATAPAAVFQSEWLKSLTWRCIGPAAMGGRIVDVAVVESDPCCFYLATASGGLFKTTNNGISFTPVFDHQNTISIGDVAVAPSNPEIVWVGTGEHNGRNSVSWGDGLYKSTDGGKSWTHMGLKDSYQIGRIAIHPRNPDIVYVGALGRLWGENEERGVFKTIDGGKTWQKVLFVDAKTGCIDLVLHPDEPETILAAMYERQRGIYDDGDPVKRWGPGSGLYRSVNGGQDWTKLTAGLPTLPMGRIGVTYSKKNPRTVFAIIETEKVGTGPSSQGSDATPAYMGIQGEDITGGAKLTAVTPEGPADKSGLRENDVVTEVDGKPVANYTDLTSRISDHKAGDKVKVKYVRDEVAGELELTFAARPAGSRGAPTSMFSSGLGGQRENVQDRQGPDGFQTGGVFKSTDGGDTWTRVNSLNPRPFYYSQIIVDPNDPDKVYVLGISAYRSNDGGKTFSADLARGVHSDHHSLWIDPRDGRHMLLGGDGGLYVSHDRGERWEHVNTLAIAQFYHVAVDNRRPYRVYGGLQDNGSWGGPSSTRSRGPGNEDWVTIGGGDGFVCQVDPNDPDLVYYTSQYGNMGRVNVRTGERRSIRPESDSSRSGSEARSGSSSAPRYRFNWKTPFILSAHNSRIFYAAGNHVFRSLDRGEKLRAISPAIPATERGTATALAESPLNADVLYVGSDDGALWVTRNGGHDWTNITQKVSGLPEKSCIATIEASRFKEGRAYVAVDAHRVDSTAPYLFVTEDYGDTWASLNANLPDGSTRTLREDLRNENLLFVGTEFGAWASLDRGQRWVRLNNNLPTVSVHELALPVTADEVVAATHGRSIWVLDITPLRQLTADAQRATVHLFRPPAATVWGSALSRSLYGHKRYLGENAADGAAIHYVLAEPAKEVSLKVVDAEGKTVRQLSASKQAGLHRSVWDLRRSQARGNSTARSGSSSSQSSPSGAAGTQPGSEAAQAAAPGTSAASAATPATAGATGPASASGAATQRSGTPGGFAAAPRALPGSYRVVLTVDGKEYSQPVAVEADPLFPAAAIEEEISAQDYLDN